MRGADPRVFVGLYGPDCSRIAFARPIGPGRETVYTCPQSILGCRTEEPESAAASATSNVGPESLVSRASLATGATFAALVVSHAWCFGSALSRAWWSIAQASLTPGARTVTLYKAL